MVFTMRAATATWAGWTDIHRDSHYGPILPEEVLH
jgi:hypothetical protein